MRAVVLTILAGVAVAAANPILETYISEVSGVSGNEFIELAAKPMPEAVRLTGWTLETSTSSCTLSCSLSYSQHLVIDSAVVAQGVLARGTFSVDPDSDCVVLTNLHGFEEEVAYPAEVGLEGSLAPGQHASACRINISGAAQTITWYLDSTPTPGDSNDDYATVSGTVRGSGGQVFDGFVATVTGPNGMAVGGGGGLSTYEAMGLNPGTYTVSVDAYLDRVLYRGSYPDPVEVPYATRVTGIDVVVQMVGIRESEVTSRPSMFGPGVLLDVTGRKVMELGPGDNDIRRLGPGTYFLRREEDDFTHKVIVQR